MSFILFSQTCTFLNVLITYGEGSSADKDNFSLSMTYRCHQRWEKNTSMALYFGCSACIWFLNVHNMKVMILHILLNSCFIFALWKLVTSTDTGFKMCRISAAVALLILSFSCFMRAAQKKQSWNVITDWRWYVIIFASVK